MEKTTNIKIKAFFKSKNFISILLGLIIASTIGYYNISLLHNLVETFSIIISIGIFLLLWNTRKIVKNDFFLFFGIAFLFIGFLDIAHTLSHKEMNVFIDAGDNLSNQLWIIARFVESISLFLILIFIDRKINTSLLFFIYSIITSILLASIFYFDIFPTCFIDGFGFTPFNQISEYIICLILLGSLVVLRCKKNKLDQQVFIYFIFAIIATIFAELVFTFNIFYESKIVGHLFKLVSYYLIFKAVVEAGTVTPYLLVTQDLIKSEEHYRSLIHQSSLGIQILDMDGNTIAVNQAWENAWGITWKEFSKLKYNILEDEQAKEFGLITLLKKAYAGEAVNVPAIEYDAHRSSGLGKKRYVQSIIYPIKNKKDEVINLVILQEDVTELKQAEIEKEKMQHQLFISSKLASVGELAAGIAHEINNPLAIIGGYIDVFEKLIDEFNIKEDFYCLALEAQKDGVERIKNIVDGMRIYMRMDQDNNEKIDVNVAITSAINIIKTVFEKNENIVIETNLCQKKLIIMGNTGKFQQIIINLLNNAKDAMEKYSGSIFIETKSVENKTIINIIDQGHGINEKIKNKIFDSFFTTKDVGKGTGLGLGIVLALVKEMNGNINVFSEEGKGAKFQIVFPNFII